MPKRNAAAAAASIPKPPIQLAVFDLDYTVWKPEMYQLMRGPTLTSVSSLPRLTEKQQRQALTTEKGKILTDGHSPITVFDGA